MIVDTRTKEALEESGLTGFEINLDPFVCGTTYAIDQPNGFNRPSGSIVVSMVRGLSFGFRPPRPDVEYQRRAELRFSSSLLVFGSAVSMLACPSDDVAPERGTAAQSVGASCDGSTPCEDLGERAVACVSGRCELTDCATGFLGCSCHPDGSCEAVYDAAVACSARGMCEAEGCQAGERYCECGGGCAAGLSCVGGVCRASASTQRVFVSDAVRACEFDVRASAPVDVVYGTGFVGRHAQRGERLGVALASEQNRAADGAVLHLVARGNETAIQLSSGRCVDGAGRALTDAGIRTE